MASIKKSKNIINNSNRKLNSFNNKNSSNQSENANSKEENSSNYIEKSFLAKLLKCDICNNIFDSYIHIPMIAKCGHTFCKKCILKNNVENEQENHYKSCPLDNIQNIFNIEACIINLRVELLIKKIFNLSPPSIPAQQQNIPQKQIVYTKPDIKKTRNNQNNNNNLNIHSPINKKNEEYGYKKIEINNSYNSKKSINRNNEINDGLNSPKIEDEININSENKFIFEDEKINGVIINETIDTIPLYDEKSFGNVSFKEDVNELIAKNNISIKKPLLNDNLKKEITKNKNITINNSKKKNKKKDIELNLNQKIQFTKPITNFSLTPNKSKDNQLLQNFDLHQNNNNTDRDYCCNNNDKIINKNKFINKNIIFENNLYIESLDKDNNKEKEIDNMAKYKNSTYKVRTLYDKIKLKLNGPGDYDYNCNHTISKKLKENIVRKNEELIYNNDNKNDNIIVINKSKNKENKEKKDNKEFLDKKNNSKFKNNEDKKDLYINTQYFPQKKIILFSNNTSNKNSNNNINRLSTNPNYEINYDKTLKKSVILNKKANILSTKILKKSNKNTIETKNDINFEDLIKSSNKKTTRNKRNNISNSDNENDILIKNRTYNSKRNDSLHNSLIGNIMNNSNNEFQKINNELNKNIKILNKSNNNSSCSNSNSNSVYNKKKITKKGNAASRKTAMEDKNNISPLKKLISVTQKESNNIFKKIINNSKSQIFLLNDSNNNSYGNKRNVKDIRDLKICEEKKINNFTSHSTIIVKKPKNTSPIILSTKHNNKNKIKIDINHNKPKDINNNDNSLNENNIRRANSFVTNNKILSTTNNNSQNASFNKSLNSPIQTTNNNINKKIKADIIQSLYDDLNKVISNMKLEKDNNIINEKKFKEMLEIILTESKFKKDIENIRIKYFKNKDFFIGIMDKNGKDPLKGILFSHYGDYYNGEFSDGKKEGKGSIIYKNGTRYEGTFKNDRHDGYGKLIQLDGEIFKGEWKNGKINGNGIRLHSNGDKYIGSYVNNIRNGQGHYIFINGDSYNGNWINGKANGIGTFQFRNGNVYEGEFKDNLILGKGILTMQNGDIFIGEFKNGFINGKGTFINKNGEKYVGNFEASKKNGEGKLFDKNGNLIKEGIWKKDIFIENI